MIHGRRHSSGDTVGSVRAKHVDSGALTCSLSFLIYRSHRVAAHAWVGRWGEQGLRYGLYNAFVLVGANPRILLVELAQFLGVDKSRASELIETMATDGLISRRRRSADHRSYGIFLTADAAAKLATLIEEVDEHERSWIDGLYNDEERRKLIELLSRVTLP